MTDFFEDAVTKAMELLEAAIASERRNHDALLAELLGQAATSKVDREEALRLSDIFEQKNLELRESVVNLEHDLETEHDLVKDLQAGNERQVTESPESPQNRRNSDRWTGTHTDFHDDNIVIRDNIIVPPADQP